MAAADGRIAGAGRDAGWLRIDDSGSNKPKQTERNRKHGENDDEFGQAARLSCVRCCASAVAATGPGDNCRQSQVHPIPVPAHRVRVCHVERRLNRWPVLVSCRLPKDRFAPFNNRSGRWRRRYRTCRLNFFFDPGDCLLQPFTAFFALVIVQRPIGRKRTLMRAPGGFVDLLTNRGVPGVRLWSTRSGSLARSLPTRRYIPSKQLA